jgi:chromosome segregation ATPase
MTEWLKELAMLMELPQDPMLIAGGAFLLGWIMARISAALSRRFKAGKRDPRDDRIRSMDAELRIAHGEVNKLKNALEEQEKQVAKVQKFVENRDEEALKRTGVIEKLTSDLKESVQKTRELRTELTDRATENIKSEVKLRDVETELSVAQASSDLIATGILDYSTEPSEKDKDDK